MTYYTGKGLKVEITDRITGRVVDYAGQLQESIQFDGSQLRQEMDAVMRGQALQAWNGEVSGDSYTTTSASDYITSIVKRATFR